MNLVDHDCVRTSSALGQTMRRSICLFDSNRAWGGGEQWYYTHALLLAERGWHVSVVTHASSVLGDRLNCHPHIALLRVGIGNASFLNPWVLARLFNFFRRNAVQALILALPSDVKAGGIAARLARIPDIIFRRGLAVPTKNTMLNRMLFRKVLTKLVCNSEYTRKMVLSENPQLISYERTFVVHNGLDVDAFDALPAAPLIPKVPGRVVVGCAGRLTSQKGHSLLMESVAILRHRGVAVTVLLAGAGELEQELRNQAKLLGLEGCFHFLGFVKEMKNFYSSIDILALPSLWEGFGYVMSEAMTMNLPVVAFDTSNIPEVVVHGETGLLVPERNVDAFADALEAVIRDPDLRVRLGQAGRKRVESCFSLAKTVPALEKILMS